MLKKMKINNPDIFNRILEAAQLKLSIAMEDIDYTLFRDDIDKQKAVELIIMSLNGISEKYISLYKSIDDNGYEKINQAYNQLKEYVSILRKVYYKTL